MKLGTLLFVVSAVAATGCAARSSSSANVPTSTTRVTAAELPVAEDAPRVGKQHHESGLTDEEEDTTPSKDGRRSERRHPGGGFSGYK